MKNDILEKIVKDYHQKCDDFDNKICSGKNKYGEAMPMGIYEFQLVQANAKIVLQNAYYIGEMNGISQEIILNYIQNFNK